MTLKRALSWGLFIVFSVAIGILLATGIRSGVLFQLDQDELVHAQISYLLLHGIIPYRQFLFTYTTIFNVLLSPIFILVGYTAHAMTIARWLMVSMFLIRVALSGWIVFRIFGKWTAILFLLFFLMDPFTMYSSMQIRPDNLMMLLFTVGLVLLLKKSYFWSAVLLATSGLVLLKIAPSLVVIWASVLWYRKGIRTFLLGFITPILLFLAFFAVSGTLYAMLQQVLMDSYAIHQALAFPVPIKHFLESGNPALYDLYGDAWTRFPFFEYASIALAAIGVLMIIFVKKKKSIVVYILAGSLIVQTIGLFSVHSAFIQYFLPVTWLINLFASVAIVRGFEVMLRYKPFYIVGLIAFIMLLTLFLSDSSRANIERSHAISNDTTVWLTSAWAQIPQNALAYPNIPFRPLAYPLPFGFYFHNLPPSVTSRLPPLVSTLEQNRVQYILKTYEWVALPQDFFTYVSDRFHEISPGVYIRND